MKKKISLVLIIIGLFIVIGCKNENNSQSNSTKQDNYKSYNINVDNPDGVQKGVAEIRVNGETIRGNVIPAAEAGSEVQVEVTLGRPVFQ